jgi:hypothetical protein
MADQDYTEQAHVALVQLTAHHLDSANAAMAAAESARRQIEEIRAQQSTTDQTSRSA